MQAKSKTKQKMAKVATEMAILFEKNIQAGDLSRFVGTANSDLRQHSSDKGEHSEAGYLLSLIAWDLLPQLIDSENKDERIKLLKVTIPNLFSACSEDGTKTSLTEIGICFLKGFEKLSSDELTIKEFMDVYSTFLRLAEMYSDYAFLQKELWKEKELLKYDEAA